MQSGAKAAIAGTIILLAAVGARIGMIYHERNAAGTWSLSGACVMVDHLDEIGWEAHRRAAENILAEHDARLAARAATVVSSVVIAIPSTRLTTAVAAFWSSGADVLNGYTTAASVASPMIQLKNMFGCGAPSMSR